MHKSIFLSGFLFLLIVTAYAQQINLDSLETLLERQPGDSNRVKILSILAWENMASQPEKTKIYASEGLELSKKIGFKKGEVLMLNYLGDCLRRQGSYAKGVEYATQSLKIATQIKDSLGMADAYRLLGMIHSFSLNQHDLALSFHLKALPVYEKSPDKNRKIALYSNIAWVYVISNQKLDGAEFYTDKALMLAKELKNQQLISWSLNSKAMIYNRRNKPDSALHYFKESIRFAEKVGDRAVIAYNRNLMANIYLKDDRIDEALELYRQNLPHIEKLSAKGLLSDAYNGLAQAFAGKNLFDSAYSYHLKHIHLKDSLISWETNQKVAIIEKEYEQEMKELKIEQLQKEKRYYILFFVLFVLGVLLILFLLLRNNRQHLKMNRLLKEKNQEIASQNQELQISHEKIATQRDLVSEQNVKLQELNETQNKLFSILGHDLNSPLNSLKGVLHLAVNQHLSMEEFKEIGGNLQNSVEHLHFTLNNLLHWANSQTHHIRTEPKVLLIYTLAEDNIHLLLEVARAKNIQLVNALSQEVEVWADADQVNLVLRNLISNALKFTPAGGTVTLTAIKNEKEWEISVSDTGVGISQENVEQLFKKGNSFRTFGTKGEKGTGLGLQLCAEMIGKNNGKIRVTSEEGKGTTFTFTLPVAGHLL